MDLRNLALFSVVAFSFVSFFIFIQHEIHSSHFTKGVDKLAHFRTSMKAFVNVSGSHHKHQSVISDGFEAIDFGLIPDSNSEKDGEQAAREPEPQITISSTGDIDNLADIDRQQWPRERRHNEHPGKLVCDGKEVDSEVIYWKEIDSDSDYESPITPHHGLHHDRYISFEYDQGGWNNVRMSLECIVVLAHATGRTLVIPPQQHLYLLGKLHQDKDDKKPHDEMGFEDFFDLEKLSSQNGFHMLTMKEFLDREGVTGGLHGKVPPGNDSTIWGNKLWNYLKQVADVTPTWMGRFIAFPVQAGNFSIPIDFNAHTEQNKKRKNPKMNGDKNRGNKTQLSLSERMKEFGGDRTPVFYDTAMQQAHHIHFPADGQHRILQHFYEPSMQSFYKRFIRDYMRYRDPIHCYGRELLRAVRQDAMALDPSNTKGEFYALHIRRGDFQFKDVKISAKDIVSNLHFPNGTAIIPSGSLVYLSTDDPDGLCVNCYVNRQPCTSYSTPKPVGCPEDTSWKAFEDAGWKLRFLRDYTKKGMFENVNQNLFGMIETIVCSRAKVFAGTYFSTFTGYIHRLRGYHGLAEETYYHGNRRTFMLQNSASIGHGWPREWRMGWTDDEYGEIV